MEITPSKQAQVGRLQVRRALPRPRRRTIGAWCFADHMGPADVSPDKGADIGPHPHMGLHTVTWLLDGQLLHKDSLGSEQVITAGQLNLMTAGHGVAHAEESTGHYRGTLEGIQLWIAQPESTRDGAPDFEHHADLPRSDLTGGSATILIGEFHDHASSARRDSDLVGVELDLHGDTELALNPAFEYGLIVLRGGVGLGQHRLGIGELAYLEPGGDELVLTVDDTSRLMLIGGTPFESPIEMWWNFVGRSRDELAAAYRSWTDDDGRFGSVASALPRIPTSPPFWITA